MVAETFFQKIEKRALEILPDSRTSRRSSSFISALFLWGCSCQRPSSVGFLNELLSDDSVVPFLH